MDSFQKRLYLATIAENADALAHKWNLGLEVDEFCTAMNMDNLSEWVPIVANHLASSDRFVFHAPFSDLVPVSIDPLIRDVVLRRYQQAYGLAHRMEIKRMVYHFGYIPRATYKDWYIDELSGFWRSFIQDKDRDFSFLIENVLDEEPEMLCRLIDNIDDPRVRVCLDVGHAHCCSTVPVLEWIEKLGSRIAHLHLHDNDGTADSHLPLGEGSIPIKEVLERLDEVSPESTITIENQWPERSLDWLTKHHYI